MSGSAAGPGSARGLGSVLVIDDDAAFRFALKKALRRLGFAVDEAAGGREALSKLHAAEPPDAALLDLRMGDLDGLEVLRRSRGVRTRVVVLTGHGSVEAAVEAMQLGAFSFLEKPVDAELLSPLLIQAIGSSRSAQGGAEAPPLIGRSSVMQEIRKFVERVGPTDATVAIYGETGTGKDVVARHLHLMSQRAAGPFVALNAACVPRELFESELFGHKKGAFTGATADRLGLFREADGGTLFIDELSELPLDSQAKLLRALETRTIRPVGDSREHPVDARIIAATNKDLWARVHEGRFREDLYFRLQVFPVVLPPLRARKEDIPALAEHLLQRLGGDPPRLGEGAVEALLAHDWPGNVRELLNVLRRASLFATNKELDGALIRRMIAASIFAHVPARERFAPPATTPMATPTPTPTPTPMAEATSASVEEEAPEDSLSSLADVERAHIARTLERVEGNITRAASILGIDRRTLQRKLRGYDLE